MGCCCGGSAHTKEDQIKELKQYKEALEREAQAVSERIRDLEV